MDESSELLRIAILAILAKAGRPLSAVEIAQELARLALEGRRIALRDTGERGH